MPNLEAEKLNAQAEVERAKGAAEAIRIENGSITPTYIQYLWVRQQSDLSNTALDTSRLRSVIADHLELSPNFILPETCKPCLW